MHVIKQPLYHILHIFDLQNGPQEVEMLMVYSYSDFVVSHLLYTGYYICIVIYLQQLIAHIGGNINVVDATGLIPSMAFEQLKDSVWGDYWTM